MVHWQGHSFIYWNLIHQRVTKPIIRMPLTSLTLAFAIRRLGMIVFWIWFLAHNFPSGLHFLVLNAKSNKANALFCFLSFLLKCALHPMLTLCYCVCSLIGKKVFTVPKESLDGVENVLAICSRAAG